MLFMVRYLQEVQGPKHVVGRDFAYIAATPEARRLFLSTARHLMLQVRTDVHSGVHQPCFMVPCGQNGLYWTDSHGLGFCTWRSAATAASWPRLMHP